MAEDMITRAAKALYDCESVRAGHSAKVIAGIARGPRDVGIEPFEECAETTWLPDARHALLAALDPEDESLVLHLAKHIRYATPGDEDFDISRARAAVDALKRLAQGET